MDLHCRERKCVLHPPPECFFDHFGCFVFVSAFCLISFTVQIASAEADHKFWETEPASRSNSSLPHRPVLHGLGRASLGLLPLLLEGESAPLSPHVCFRTGAQEDLSALAVRQREVLRAKTASSKERLPFSDPKSLPVLGKDASQCWSLQTLL